MNQILKPYVESKPERLVLIQHLLTQFEKQSSYRYLLQEDPKIYLILSRDERLVRNSHKYSNSPFPLLSTVEVFRTSIGSWNEELLEYGLRTRQKYGDSSDPSTIGSHIYLIHTSTITSTGNNYLKRQYKRLFNYRARGDINSYWKLCWTLLCKSWCFRLACLNSWSPRWYKTLSLKHLSQVWEGLHRILSLEDPHSPLRNVWIESPKGKWRQLCIPKPSWRLYYHILNQFLSYIYYPLLPRSDYDGFLYQRGCLSWWKGILWGNYLTSYSHLLEVDFSSAFPNLNRRYLYKSLKSDNLVPLNFIHLLLTHLQSSVESSNHYPTYSSYVEDKENVLWRQSTRNLPMGVGISPLLFVISMRHAFESLGLKSKDLLYRMYADDGSLFFNSRGVWNLLKLHWKGWLWLIHHLTNSRNLLIELLNESLPFQESGLKICNQKSRLIRLFHIWLHPYVSLGLRLHTPLTYFSQLYYLLQRKSIPLELSGWTRGRGSNPVKGKSSTLPSRTPLNYWNSTMTSQLDLSRLLSSYGKYFGLIQSKLYSSSSEVRRSSLSLRGQRGSILHTLLPLLKDKNKNLLNVKLDIYNAGSKISELYLESQSRYGLSLQWSLLSDNLEREVKVSWKEITKDPFNTKIANPLPKKSYIESEGLDYFKKFSEIQLTETQHNKYYKEYVQQKLPTEVPNSPIG